MGYKELTTESDSFTGAEIKAWKTSIMDAAQPLSQAYNILASNGMVIRGSEETFYWPIITASEMLTGFATRTNQYDAFATDDFDFNTVTFSTVDKRKGLTVPITLDALQSQKKLGLGLDLIKKQLALAMAKQKDIDILRNDANGDVSASSIPHAVVCGSDSTVDSGDIVTLEDIAELKAMLEEDDCHPTHLFIHPYQEFQLLKDSAVRSAMEYGRNTAVRTGHVPTLLGLEIIVTTNVAAYTSSATDFNTDGYEGLMIDVNRAYGIYENEDIHFGVDITEKQTLYEISMSYKQDIQLLDSNAAGLLVSSKT